MPEIFISEHFKRHLKKYLKKYRSLGTDILATLESFEPRQHIHLGEGLYKVRLYSSDLKRGKNRSFRLIILLYISQNLLTPITLYFKGDQRDMAVEKIKREVRLVLAEII